MNLMLLIHGTSSVNHMLRDIVERLILQETSIKFVHHRNLFLDLFALMPCHSGARARALGARGGAP